MKILLIKNFSPKIGEKKKLSKSVSGYYKTKKKEEKNGPLSHWCREGKTLVVRPLKKPLFLCVSSLTHGAVVQSLFVEPQL